MRLSWLVAVSLIAGAAAQCCDELHHRYDKDKRLNKTVSMFGAVRRGGVALYWADAAARAAAALLRAQLEHVERYARVTLRRGPRALQHVYKLLNATADTAQRQDPTEVSVVMSAVAGAAPLVSPERRLAALGAGAAPPGLRLLARAAPGAPAHCALPFSAGADLPGLAVCGYPTTREAGREELVVYAVNPGEDSETVAELERCANGSATPVCVRRVSRGELQRALAAGGGALLLDYALWPELAALAPPAHACAPPAAASVRVVELDLVSFDPQLYAAIVAFNPAPESLMRVLSLVEEGLTFEEAGCKLMVTGPAFKNHPVTSRFNVNVYLWLEDPDYEKYKDILQVVHRGPLANSTISPDFTVGIRWYDVENRSDPSALERTLHESFEVEQMYRSIGAVTCGAAPAVRGALAARTSHMALLQYDAAPRGAPGLAAAGRAQPLAAALRSFARAHSWARLAVLSAPGELAADWIEALGSDLYLHEIAIPSRLYKADVHRVLGELRDVDARIIFVNADKAAADALVSAAPSAGMGTASRYVWLAREWPPAAPAAAGADAVRLLTFTYWSRGEEAAHTAAGGRPQLRRAISALWPDRDWPALTEPLVDSILTLNYAFQKIVGESGIRYDFHTPDIMRKFESVIASESASWTGLLRELRYSGGARADPVVYVDAWRGASRERLGSCAGAACAVPAAFRSAAPADGTPACLIQSGRGFKMRCLDWALASGLLLAGAAAGGAWLARRAVRRHVAARELAVLRRLAAQRDRAAGTLAAHVVPRAAIELREELGAGSFGCVRLATLREPGRAPRLVAAKAPRAGAAPAEESEFLREACALAALRHEHVVRLLGVVVDEAPPLVLMELAFFGDLLRYLRARRPLAEAGAAEADAAAGEAQHVAPAALTRLAREAAAALSYLALRGVVHRDVRAANCLLDARRSLKLADFGMARELARGADGAAEYACRRRALFPVLWMAPESLARGVFSAASDVWALGVLLLEIATLGARPYGDAAPLRVLRYVAAGGQPPLPPDATPQTRGVLAACWRRAPEQRPRAAELVAWLAAHGRALAPALATPRAAPSDADSGFGEPELDETEPFHCTGTATQLSAGARPTARRNTTFT